ncbi:hypothetical protein M3M33_14085, partial [Loigolactobacillus coryniformis]|uniref:hypothetical protein n=1 Tax=Loigolactobacillus coryniformis TaxID=1610 RepID=UPI00201A9F63
DYAGYGWDERWRAEGVFVAPNYGVEVMMRWLLTVTMAIVCAFLTSLAVQYFGGSDYMRGVFVCAVATFVFRLREPD